MEKRLLITGFQPFGGQPINPSWEAVQGLPEQIGEWVLHKLCIPVVFGQGAQLVLDAMTQCSPHAVISVGQAGGRCAITPEQVAINLRNGTDNGGNHFQDSPVMPQGPDAYFTTLPIRAMAEAIKEAGLPASISYSAGTYVCNDLMYTLLHHCQKSGIPAGFIHVPYLPQQTNGQQPSLPLESVIKALAAAIGVL